MVSEALYEAVSKNLSADLKQNLDIIKKNVETNDLDWVIGVVGPERSGKSNLMLQILIYLNPKLELSSILFDRTQFLDFLSNAPDRSVVCCDEAANMFYKRNFAEDEQKEVNKALMKIGIKNLIMGMVLPDLSDIDAHIRTWRLRFLIKTQFEYNPKTQLLERGKFSFYGWETIKQITKSAGNSVTTYPRADGYGHFKAFPDNEFWGEYLKVKRAYVDQAEKVGTKEEIILEKAIKICKKDPKLWERVPYVQKLIDDAEGYRVGMVWWKFDFEKLEKKYNFLYEAYIKKHKELEELKKCNSEQTPVTLQ